MKWILLTIIFFFPQILFADSLRVGVAGSVPFHFANEKTVKGISTDIWKEIALANRFLFQYKYFENISEVLQAVNRKEIDVAVGPISITSKRYQLASFTQPYYQSNKGILTHQDSTSLWHAIKPFLQTTFLWGVLSLIIVLFIVGNLVWIAEKNKNDNFPKTYWRGVGNGMWFSIVTFTTVGYGDLTPVTRLGRFITGSWMIIALLTASSMTAGIATAFTMIQLKHSSIDSPEALVGRRVAVVRGSTGEEYANEMKARVISLENIDKAILLLQKNEVAAVISDAPILHFLSNKKKLMDYKVITIHEEKDFYGFALAHGSPLLKNINQSILSLKEKGVIRKINRKWLQTP